MLTGVVAGRILKFSPLVYSCQSGTTIEKEKLMLFWWAQ